MDNLDNYAHRLSIKNNICYESAHNILKDSIDRLADHKYESENMIRSAYKYSRHKLEKQKGGNNDLIPLVISKQFQN